MEEPSPKIDLESFPKNDEMLLKVNGKELSVRFELERLQEDLKSLAKQRGIEDRMADYEAELLRVYFYEKYTDYKDQKEQSYTAAEGSDPLHEGPRGESPLRFFQEGIQKELDRRTKGKNVPDEVAIQQIKSLMNTTWRHEAEHILQRYTLTDEQKEEVKKTQKETAKKMDIANKVARIGGGAAVFLSWAGSVAYNVINEGAVSFDMKNAAVLVAVGVGSLYVAENIRSRVENHYYVNKDPLETGAREAEKVDVSHLRDIFEVNINK